MLNSGNCEVSQKMLFWKVEVGFGALCFCLMILNSDVLPFEARAVLERWALKATTITRAHSPVPLNTNSNVEPGSVTNNLANVWGFLVTFLIISLFKVDHLQVCFFRSLSPFTWRWLNIQWFLTLWNAWKWQYNLPLPLLPCQSECCIDQSRLPKGRLRCGGDGTKARTVGLYGTD